MNSQRSIADVAKDLEASRATLVNVERSIGELEKEPEENSFEIAKATKDREFTKMLIATLERELEKAHR